MSTSEIQRTTNVVVEPEVVLYAGVTWSPSGSGAVISNSLHLPTVRIEHLRSPRPTDRRLVMLGDPTLERSRGYRALLHRLLSCGDPRVIAVTSASPGEGKTTCATNLALAIAEDTMTSVLIIDANLRRPAVAEVFGFRPRDSFVADIARSKDVLCPYPVVGIYGVRLHIAALPRHPMPEGRLERTLFSVALCDLRSVYDYIVIDAASVLESGDADVVGECSDAVIVATRAGSSRRADVGRAVELLRPAVVLGGVLIDT